MMDSAAGGYSLAEVMPMETCADFDLDAEQVQQAKWVINPDGR